MRPTLYFLCTGNSCRSQMAEGFARYMFGDQAEVASGGIAPKGVHPLAVRVMAEVGIDISRHESRPIDAGLLIRSSVAVTLCGDAEEMCPVTPPSVLRMHWPLHDPARIEGDLDARLGVFRKVRDEIQARVARLGADMGFEAHPPRP